MYASEGKANAALTTGIIGTAGVGLGIIGNIINTLTGGGKAERVQVCDAVGHYELALIQQLEAEKSRNALLEANIYTDQKLATIYEKLDAKIGANRDAIAQQAVYNATVNATLGCIQGQIAQLMGLTKLVIPNTSICPAPTTT